MLNPCSQAVQGLAAAQYLAAPLSPCSPPQAQQLLAIALTLLMTVQTMIIHENILIPPLQALHCGSTKATVKLNTAITGVKLAALLVTNLLCSFGGKYIFFGSQAIIVAGVITFGTGNSPGLEVRSKCKDHQFPPSRHSQEHPARRRTMSVLSTEDTGRTRAGRESRLELRT